MQEHISCVTDQTCDVVDNPKPSTILKKNITQKNPKAKDKYEFKIQGLEQNLIRKNTVTMNITAVFPPAIYRSLYPFISFRPKLEARFEVGKNGANITKKNQLWLPIAMAPVRVSQGPSNKCVYRVPVVWSHSDARGYDDEDAIAIFEDWDDEFDIETQMRDELDKKDLKDMDEMLECCKEPAQWEQV